MVRRLIGYLPPVLSKTCEMSAIMAAEQPEMETAWDMWRQVLHNAFVQTADARGLARWEKVMGILPKAQDTTEQRRLQVLTRLNEKLPYTVRVLHQMLTACCGPDGYRLSVSTGEYQVVVQIELAAKEHFTEVQAMLERVVPANMRLLLDLRYNTYGDLRGRIYADLGRVKYRDLREEALG